MAKFVGLRSQIGVVAPGGNKVPSEVIALALIYNPKVWGMMYNGQISGTAEQLAGLQMVLKI